MNIIVGAIIIIVGAVIIMKSDAMLKAFGRIPFFEKHLGTEGGSRLGYQIIGFLGVIIGLLVMTGSFEGLILAIFSPVTG
jgi:hypothetical protein